MLVEFYFAISHSTLYNTLYHFITIIYILYTVYYIYYLMYTLYNMWFNIWHAQATNRHKQTQTATSHHIATWNSLDSRPLQPTYPGKAGQIDPKAHKAACPTIYYISNIQCTIYTILLYILYKYIYYITILLYNYIYYMLI